MSISDSPDVLARELCVRFNVPPEHEDALIKFLQESAGQFNPSRRITSAAKQQIGVREQLEAVAQTRERLAETLDGLSPLARDRLWHPLWEMPDRLPNLIGFATLPPTKDFPEEKSFRENLVAFGKRIEARLVELRAVKDKGGHPESTGLRIWTARARDFWEGTLGRKFTYQYFLRVRKSAAFDFCSFVLQRIAPDINERALATAMRAVIRPMNVLVRVSTALFPGSTPQSPSPEMQKFVDEMKVTVTLGPAKLP